MKFKKYRIVKQFGKYYIDIPFLYFFWKRLTYTGNQEVGTSTYQSVHSYAFGTYQEASDFAFSHKYGIEKVSK